MDRTFFQFVLNVANTPPPPHGVTSLVTRTTSAIQVPSRIMDYLHNAQSNNYSID